MSEFIFREVARVLTKYKTRDPYELLDGMGAVTYFSYEYGRNGLKGYSTVMNRLKYAVINANLPPEARKVVAGHEAAHLILHMDDIMSSPIRALHDFNMFDNAGRIEYQANLFLADFLLEDDEVLERVYDEYKDFFGIARELYVPAPLLAFKQHSMMRRGLNVRNPIDLDSQFLK